MTAIPVAVPCGSSGAPVESVVSIARAVANDTRLRADEGHCIVVRPDPSTLAITGLADEALAADVALLRRQILTTVPHTRALTFDNTVELATRLAARLRVEVPDLSDHVVVPVARGGLFVAGMLAYLVPLEKHRFAFGDHHEAPDAPALVVDDIILSGLRISSTLRRLNRDSVTVATLCAASPLLDLLAEREPSVTRFLTASALPDRTADLVGIDLDSYRRRWEADGVHWVGRTDHVIFPWSEPDGEATNPVTGRPSPSWKLAPPDLCLGNPARTDGETPPVLLDCSSLAADRLIAGWLIGSQSERNTTVIVDESEPGPTFKLEGIAHDMFWAVVEEQDRRAALRRLESAYDVDASTLAADLDEFVGELVDEGVLKPMGP